MLVMKLTAEEVRNYAGALREAIRAEAKAEAEERLEKTVRIVGPNERLIEQFMVDPGPGAKKSRIGGGLSKKVLQQVARTIPNGKVAWKEIQRVWKETKKPLGRKTADNFFVHEGVYYRIERGKPVRVAGAS